MRVSELTGALLDCWVARAEGLSPAAVSGLGRACFALDDGKGFEVSPYSTNWAEGGAIIERLRIATDPLTRHRDETPDWQAQIWDPYACQKGPTALIAAMRAYVESKFGATVPDEAAQ